jgi:hypothetical protein
MNIQTKPLSEITQQALALLTKERPRSRDRPLGLYKPPEK